MRSLILSLGLILLTSFTPVENDVDFKFLGVWKSVENDFVQITRNNDFEISFMRIGGDRLLKAKGIILSAEEGTINVKRSYPVSQEYFSEYVFSPSGETLVISKPNSNQAWLFERVSY